MDEAHGLAMGVNILRPRLALIHQRRCQRQRSGSRRDAAYAAGLGAAYAYAVSAPTGGSGMAGGLCPLSYEFGQNGRGSPCASGIVSYCTGMGVDVGVGIGEEVLGSSHLSQ